MSVRYRFAEYAFETARGLEGPLGRIPLRARDAHLLSMMLEGDGRVVTEDAIAGTVWPDRDVSDDSITQSVRRLRLAMPSPAGRRSRPDNVFVLSDTQFQLPGIRLVEEGR